MENKRSALYDNVRFLLIFLVVIGHFVELYLARSNAYRSIVIFIYSFHMPLFLFVAGLFYKDKDTTAKAVAYICIGYLLKMILALEKQLISGQFEFSLLSEEYIPWYMFALAFYIVISHVLRNVDKRLLLIMSVLLSCFAGYDDTVGVFLTLSRIIVFYPFFLLGQMCSYEGLAALSRKPVLRVTGAAVLIAWAAACVLLREKLFPLRPLLLGRHPYSVSEEFLPWGGIYRLFCYALAVPVGFAVICVTPSRRIPLVTLVGQRTLQIFFWHWPIVRLLNPTLGIGRTLTLTLWGKLLWIACAAALAMLLGAKCFSFPTQTILRLTKGQPSERPRFFS